MRVLYCNYDSFGLGRLNWSKFMLKLTKRSDYGLIALRHLAVAGPTGVVTAKEISDTYKIPQPLLAKVLQTLTKRGFLSAAQGAHGGYRLAKPASKITTLDVVRTIDGPVILTSCSTHNGSCDQNDVCTVKAPLGVVHEEILKLLDSITVADLSMDMPKMPPKLYSVTPMSPEVNRL
jgi:Rrf2 family protein